MLWTFSSYYRDGRRTAVRPTLRYPSTANYKLTSSSHPTSIALGLKFKPIKLPALVFFNYFRYPYKSITKKLDPAVYVYNTNYFQFSVVASIISLSILIPFTKFSQKKRINTADNLRKLKKNGMENIDL